MMPAEGYVDTDMLAWHITADTMQVSEYEVHWQPVRSLQASISLSSSSEQIQIKLKVMNFFLEIKIWDPQIVLFSMISLSLSLS